MKMIVMTIINSISVNPDAALTTRDFPPDRQAPITRSSRIA